MKKYLKIGFGFLGMIGFSVNIMASEVDLTKSKFTWKGTKVTGEHAGNISLKSAKIEQAKDGKLKKGEFIINMDTITVTELTGEWKTKFLTHMKSKDFFEIKKYPTAKLVVNKDNGKKVNGKLTIKGKTHPVEIKYTKKGKVFKGQFTFDRTKFDMIYGSGDFFKKLGDKMIHNKVTLNFDITVK